MSTPTLTQGRIVRYWSTLGVDGELVSVPAIVTAARDDHAWLTVLWPNYDFYGVIGSELPIGWTGEHGECWLSDVPHAEVPTAGHWSWPELVR